MSNQLAKGERLIQFIKIFIIHEMQTTKNYFLLFDGSKTLFSSPTAF